MKWRKRLPLQGAAIVLLLYVEVLLTVSIIRNNAFTAEEPAKLLSSKAKVITGFTGQIQKTIHTFVIKMNSNVSLRKVVAVAMALAVLYLCAFQFFTALTIHLVPRGLVPTSAPFHVPTCDLTNGLVVEIQGDTLKKSSIYYSSRWGNVLSPYWAVRAMAELGGYQYSGAIFGYGTWMQFLPRRVDAPSSGRPARLVRACQECGENFHYFHRCYHGWGEIVATIRNDTRMALAQYAVTRPTEERDGYEKLFQPNDWLIYERCCILCHAEHGFGGLRTYDSIIAARGGGNFTVFTLTQNQIDDAGNEGMGLCHSLRQKAMQSIQRRHPNVQIVVLENAEPWVDFARIVYAPNLLVPSAGSSWALWALLANDGNVVTVPMLRDMDVSAYPKNVNVLTEAEVLHPDTEDLIAGVRNDIAAESPEGRAKIIEWFLTH